MEEERRGHKQKKEGFFGCQWDEERGMWNGRVQRRRKEEREERRVGHDGIRVPQWQIESFEEPKLHSRLNTKTFHRGCTATEKQLQSLSFEAPAIYGDFNCLCKSGSNWEPRRYKEGLGRWEQKS